VRRFFNGNGELLESARRFEQFLAVDVRVPRDRREVGVAEVLGDEPSVAELLTEPGRGGVAQRVCRCGRRISGRRCRTC
jgi:hypothetical protein